MKYIINKVTWNKIRALIYIFTYNPEFIKHINSHAITSHDNDSFNKMQVMNYRNEYSYLLELEDNNTIRITRDESMINLSYDISSLHLVVETDDYMMIQSIRFEDDKGNRIGLWSRKVELVKGDFTPWNFIGYVKMFADEVED